MKEEIREQLDNLSDNLSVDNVECLQDLVNKELLNNDDINVKQFLNDISHEIYNIVIKYDFNKLDEEELKSVIICLFIGMDYTLDFYEDLSLLMLCALELMDCQETKEYRETIKINLEDGLTREREEIDYLDNVIIEALIKRLGITKKVKKKKQLMHKEVEDNVRENEIYKKLDKLNYSEQLKKIYEEIINQSKKIQGGK